MCRIDAAFAGRSHVRIGSFTSAPIDEQKRSGSRLISRMSS